MLKQGKLLQKAIKISDYSINEVIDKTKISRGTLYNLFKEDIIPDEYKEMLAPLKLNLELNTKSVGVPVYNTDFTAGDITQFSDEPSRIVGHIDLNGFRRCKAFVQVKGDSMYPKFIAGDVIGIEEIEDFKIIEYGQPFAIVTKTNQRLVKNIRKGKDDNHLILRSENKEYDDINIHKSDIEFLFKVRGPVRDQWQ